MSRRKTIAIGLVIIAYWDVVLSTWRTPEQIPEAKAAAIQGNFIRIRPLPPLPSLPPSPVAPQKREFRPMMKAPGEPQEREFRPIPAPSEEPGKQQFDDRKYA